MEEEEAEVEEAEAGAEEEAGEAEEGEEEETEKEPSPMVDGGKGAKVAGAVKAAGLAAVVAAVDRERGQAAEDGAAEAAAEGAERQLKEGSRAAAAAATTAVAIGRRTVLRLSLGATASGGFTVLVELSSLRQTVLQVKSAQALPNTALAKQIAKACDPAGRGDPAVSASLLGYWLRDDWALYSRERAAQLLRLVEDQAWKWYRALLAEGSLELDGTLLHAPSAAAPTAATGARRPSPRPRREPAASLAASCAAWDPPATRRRRLAASMRDGGDGGADRDGSDDGADGESSDGSAEEYDGVNAPLPAMALDWTTVQCPPAPPPVCECRALCVWARRRWWCAREDDGCGFESGALPAPAPLTPLCACARPCKWLLNRWWCARHPTGGCGFELTPTAHTEPTHIPHGLATRRPPSDSVAVAAARDCAAMLTASAFGLDDWCYVAPTDCGLGLFARSALRKGQHICEYKGPHLPLEMIAHGECAPLSGPTRLSPRRR